MAQQTKTQFATDAHETAFEILKPLLDTMTAPKRYALDLGECIKAGFRLQNAVEQPIVRASLDELSAKHFDAEKRAHLPIATKALLYVKTRLQSARVQSSKAKVPQETMTEAKQLHHRLKTLAEYYLDTQEDVKELKDIRKGRGHKNLAYNLTRLSQLLEERKDVVRNDTKYYREEDLERAPQLALEILEGLTDQNKPIWQDYAERLFMLFRTSYDEVQQAATFVMRQTAYANDFPKLFAAARKVRKKTRGKEGLPSNTPVQKAASATQPSKKASPMPQSVESIATEFVQHLESPDWPQVATCLDETCVYRCRGQIIEGIATIVDTYRKMDDWAHATFHSVRYEHRVEVESSHVAIVHLRDCIDHEGHHLDFRCQQRITVNEADKIVKIEHIDLPGEREKVDAFNLACGVVRPTHVETT